MLSLFFSPVIQGFEPEHLMSALIGCIRVRVTDSEQNVLSVQQHLLQIYAFAPTSSISKGQYCF